MRKLVDVLARVGNKPGDAKLAAKMIRGGRVLLGNVMATLPYYQGKAPPPPDDRWFCLIESSRGVVGYVAAALGTSERIPSIRIVGMVVPVEAKPELSRELAVLMLAFSADMFFNGSGGCGWVTIDLVAENGVVREAAESIGFTAVSERQCGKDTVIRYALFPRLTPTD